MPDSFQNALYSRNQLIFTITVWGRLLVLSQFIYEETKAQGIFSNCQCSHGSPVGWQDLNQIVHIPSHACTCLSNSSELTTSKRLSSTPTFDHKYTTVSRVPCHLWNLGWCRARRRHSRTQEISVIISVIHVIPALGTEIVSNWRQNYSSL